MVHTRQKLATSERRACRVIGLARSTLHYRAAPKDDEALRLAMIRLAKHYEHYGYRKVVDALTDRSPRPKSVWNRIPEKVREDIVDFAPEHEDLMPREPAVKYTDEKRYFVSESSVCRILSTADLITARSMW